MNHLTLPVSLTRLVNHLQVVEFKYKEKAFCAPKFAIYAILDRPVFDDYLYKKGRRVGLLKLEKYQIPVLCPFGHHLESTPQKAVIISHNKGNAFGLYAYAIDSVIREVNLPQDHRSVGKIIKPFVS
jgi:hypothetical protein